VSKVQAEETGDERMKRQIGDEKVDWPAFFRRNWIRLFSVCLLMILASWLKTLDMEPGLKVLNLLVVILIVQGEVRGLQ